MAQRGIIYSATGAGYITEAINSAKSSLRFNHIPHLIFCDAIPAEKIDGVEFIPIQSCGDPFGDKIRSIYRLPFDQTIFLDGDTYLTANIDDVFDLLNRFEVTAAHAPAYTKGGDRGQSEAFYDFNTGVIGLRRTASVLQFLARWIEIDDQWTRSLPFYSPARDQSSFRRAIWESVVSFYVLGPEYNYRSVYPGRLVGRAKIIHGRSTNYEKLAAHLNAKTGARSFEAFSADRVW
jgi:hypothetical protein